MGRLQSVAVPLFTATGNPVASLNLWSRTSAGLQPPDAALNDLFGSDPALTDWHVAARSDPR